MNTIDMARSLVTGGRLSAEAQAGGTVLPNISANLKCVDCEYVYAWSVSPGKCPQCGSLEFENWQPTDYQRDARNGTTWDYVRLADNEWGNFLMGEVASEWFHDHPDCKFVHIYEHGGWFLTYHRSGSIVGTANDLAVMDPNRPRSTGYSGLEYRRPVRSTAREVTSLIEYDFPGITARAQAANTMIDFMPEYLPWAKGRGMDTRGLENVLRILAENHRLREAAKL